MCLGFENGNFVGPTILHGVDKANPAYSEEIFGPVLVSLELDTLEEAIEFTNSSKYGQYFLILMNRVHIKSI